MPSSPSQEYAFIESLRRILPQPARTRYPMGIGDDAVGRLCRGDEHLFFTTDASVENVHFRLDWMSLAEVGYRAMVSNASDCAAMGARPEAALVQLAFPSKHPRIRQAIRSVYHGFRAACDDYEFEVVGGDLCAGAVWMIAITMIGRLPEGCRALQRNGVKAGDRLWVTGRPGESGAGFAALKRWSRKKAPRCFQKLVRRHIAPSARVDAGVMLACNTAVRAAIDISDGIAKEAHTLAHMSGVHLELRFPPEFESKAMRMLAEELGVSWERWALFGGEDYELLFAASSDFDPRSIPVETFCIGRALEGSGVSIYENGRSKPLKQLAWDHLRGG